MIKLQFPLTDDAKKQLKAGDTVLLSGEVITGRDKAVLRSKELLEKGASLPYNLQNATLFYVGPTFDKRGRITSAGPTTSKRMDGIVEPLLDRGINAIIGKGDVAQSVKDAMLENGVVYFAAIGGAGALCAKCIKSCSVIAFAEYGTEAVYRFVLQDLPAVVAFDTHGESVY